MQEGNRGCAYSTSSSSSPNASPLDVLVFRLALGFFLVFVFIRDHVETNRMYLNDLDLSLALRAVEDLAFLYFVFVNVNLDGTFRTADHSRTSWPKIALDASRRII